MQQLRASASEASQQLLAQVQTQWKGWRPYFVKLLRDVFGEDGLLIANTAGPMSLPGLNGVTVSWRPSSIRCPPDC